MTVIYLTEYITRSYGVTFQNIGSIKVQKFEDIFDDERNIFYVRPLRMIFGKSKICEMTNVSGAYDKKTWECYSTKNI